MVLCCFLPSRGKTVAQHLDRYEGLSSIELERVRADYNGVRLHQAIGYVKPDDEHEGRGEAHPPSTHRRVVAVFHHAP